MSQLPKTALTQDEFYRLNRNDHLKMEQDIAAWSGGGTGSYVDLISDQNIDGTKTFLHSPHVPTPTGSDDVASKGYVDAISAPDLTPYLKKSGSPQDVSSVLTYKSGYLPTAEQSPSTDNQLARKKYVDDKNHNDFKNIQGGTTNERYHLTDAQVDIVNDALLCNQPVTSQVTSGTFELPNVTVNDDLKLKGDTVSDYIQEASTEELKVDSFGTISDHQTTNVDFYGCNAFTANANYYLSSFKLKLTRINGGGTVVQNYRVSIRRISSGTPTLTDLWYQDCSASDIGITTNWISNANWTTKLFTLTSPIYLASGSEYGICVIPLDGSDGMAFASKSSSTSTNLWYYLISGASWSNYGDRNVQFQLYGQDSIEVIHTDALLYTHDNLVSSSDKLRFIDQTNLTLDGELDIKGSTLLGDGGEANYTNFDTSGHQTMEGDARPWRDELGDAISLQRNGAGISEDLNENVINFDHNAVYHATPTLADFLRKNVQLNHDRDLTAKLYPHIHWFQAKGYAPNFFLEYRWQVNGGVKTGEWKKLKCNSLAFTYASGTIHQISYSEGIQVPYGSNISDVIQFRIYRDTTNASSLFTGNCPYNTEGNASTGILSFDVHFMINSLGSTDEYTK